MRGISITDCRAQGGKTDAACDGGEPRQDSPAFQDRLIGCAYAGYLDHVVHDREPDEPVIFRPLRFRLHRLERLGGIRTVEPGRVMNAELHDFWLDRSGFDFRLGAARSRFVATRRAAASAARAHMRSSSGSSNSRSGARQNERSIVLPCFL